MIPRPHLRTLLVTASAALLIGVTAACSSDDDPTSTPTAEASEPTATATLEAPATSEATTEATTEATATSEATPDPTTTASADTVSANNATMEELTTAFEAAGIANADRWAREVDEYRPYAEDDTDYAKLRRELAKYNPSVDTVDAILATLHLP